MEMVAFVGVWLLGVALVTGIMVVVLRLVGRLGTRLTSGKRRAVSEVLPPGETPTKYAVGFTPPPSAPAMVGYVALACTPLTPIVGMGLFVFRHHQRLIAETSTQMWVLRPKSRLSGRGLEVVGVEQKAEWAPERRHAMGGLLGTVAGERVAFMPGYTPDLTGQSRPA